MQLLPIVFNSDYSEQNLKTLSFIQILQQNIVSKWLTAYE